MIRTLAFVGLLLLVAGSASAAHVEVKFDQATATTVQGPVDVQTSSGVLNVTQAILAGSHMTLDVTSLQGHVVTLQRFAIRPVASQEALYQRTDDRQSANVTSEGARLDGFECGNRECFVVLVADGHGKLGATLTSLDLAQLNTPHAYCTYFCNAEDDPARVMGAGSFTLATSSSDASTDIQVGGKVLLLARDAKFVVHEGQNTRTVDTREVDERDTSTERGTISFAAIELTAVGSSCPDCAVTMDADTLQIQTAGSFSSPHATGTLRSKGQEHAFRDAPILIDGTLGIDFRPLRLSTIASPNVQGTESAGFASGEATFVQIAGETVIERPAQIPIVSIAVGASGIAILVLVLSRVAVAFYTRIEPRRILENEHRARIHAFVGTNPGANAATLGRELHIPRTVAHHHLRMLETHSLLLRRRVGLESRYYHPHVAPTQSTLETLRVLEDPTRAKIARLIADQPGRSQAELCEASGVSQRLMSYHVQRLVASGLILPQGRNPQRYSATQFVQARENATAATAS